MDEQNNHQKMVSGGKTTCTMCGAVSGGGCSCGHHMGYHVLRWVLGLFILFFVFAIGVKVGEFITELRSYANYSHSYGMMQSGTGYYNPGGPMMPAGVENSATTTTVTP